LSDDELACPPIEDLDASCGPERLLVALSTATTATVRALRLCTHLKKAARPVKTWKARPDGNLLAWTTKDRMPAPASTKTPTLRA